METHKLKYAEDESLEACGVYLRQILDGLESQSLSLSRGEEQVCLRPSGPVRFKLKVKQKGKEEEVRVELSWSRADEVPLVASGIEVEEDEHTDSPRHQSRAVEEGAERTDASPQASECQAADIKIAERWMTRETLYALATEHELQGRSQMSKDELVLALLGAGVEPVSQLSRKELYAIAQEAQVGGRSTMSQEELVDALRTKVRADAETMG